MEPTAPSGTEPGAAEPHGTPPIADWPAPIGAPVLLFGGSFDPPHTAHITLALAARDALFPGDGWLVFVPAARNPHKSRGPIATDTQRIEMLRLAIGDAERVGIWTDEIDRAIEDQPSFWSHTLARAREAAGAGTPIRFLIGADQALAFDRWHEHEHILTLAEPAVLLRDPCVTREAFREMLLTTGLDVEAWMPRLVDAEVLPAASTEAREAIRRGNTPTDLLDEQVLGYIDLHGLYVDDEGEGGDAD